MQVFRVAVATAAAAFFSCVVSAQIVHVPLDVLKPRIGHQMVSAGGRVWMTGGNQGYASVNFSEVHEFANGAWRSLGALGYPNAFTDSAFDPLRQTFLGLVDEGGYGMTLVEWSGTAPTYVNSIPGALYFADQQQIVFDPSRAACVVHGYDATAGTNELWSWNGTTWQLVSAVAAGPGWGTYRLLAVPGGDLMLVGMAWGSSVMETWLFQAGVWSQQPAPPVALFRFDATAEPGTGVPLVAGYTTTGTTMSVHTWNGAGWTQIGANGPDLGHQFRIANDGSQVLAFGGIHYGTPNVLHGDTWAFANGVFTQLGGRQPVAMEPLSACFDEARQRTVLVGCAGPQTETWEWDGTQFHLLHTQPGFTDGLLAYDRARDVVVQHRGDGTTLEWNGTTWVTVIPAGTGPARLGSGMAYDGQRVILFGGAAPGQSVGNETWAYDGIAWTLLAPAVSPPSSLYQPRLVEDRRRGVVVLVPGLHGAIYEWNGATWSAPLAVPTLWTRQELFVGYHRARGRVVIGGGQQTVYSPYPTTSFSLAVWEWDGTNLAPAANLSTAHLRGTTIGMPDGDLMRTGGWGTGYTAFSDFAAIRSLHPATVATFGAGCASGTGVPRLGAAPWQWPWLGDTLQMDCTNLPPAATGALWVLGLSNTQDAFGALPRDLAWAGAPGCSQRVAADLAFALGVANGTSTWLAGVPQAAGLLGLQLHLQVLALDPLANPGGFVLSDAATATVGSR